MTEPNTQDKVPDNFVTDEIALLTDHFQKRDITPKLALLAVSSFIGHILLNESGGEPAQALADLQSLVAALGKDIIATATTYGEREHAVREIAH